MRAVLQLLLEEEVGVAWTNLHQFCDYVGESIVPLALLRETGHLCKKLLPHYHLNIIIRHSSITDVQLADPSQPFLDVAAVQQNRVEI